MSLKFKHKCELCLYGISESKPFNPYLYANLFCAPWTQPILMWKYKVMDFAKA